MVFFFGVTGKYQKTMKGAEMLDTKGFMTVKQYSEYRNVSCQTVYKHIRHGKITSNSWKQGNRGYLIDTKKADKELSQNLDQIYNPGRRDPDQSARLEVQDKAVDIASEGEGAGLLPWPIWASKYITALDTLDPDRIKIELNNDDGREQWQVTVDDVNTETKRAAPWAVTMEFDFNPVG
jgi:hypothetical protein